MATRPSIRLTYDDYVDFPEGTSWELIDGEAYVVPGASPHHQLVAGELFRQVANHLKAHGGGKVFGPPLDVVLDPNGDVFQPDMVFVADEHMGVLTDANVWGTPSWAIEVLSPSRPERDRKLKLPRYERAGVPELWIVDPEAEAVEIYVLTSADVGYGPPVMVRPPGSAKPSRPQGLEIDLTEVFRR